jgi:hypothetical protein
VFTAKDAVSAVFLRKPGNKYKSINNIKKIFPKNCINYIVKTETLGNTRFSDCSLCLESAFFIHLITIKLQADLYGSACNCISREI